MQKMHCLPSSVALPFHKVYPSNKHGSRWPLKTSNTLSPPEAIGVETVLAGLRDTVSNDDQLLASASAVFDSLLAAFEKGVSSE
ncbi:MAG: chromate resistance protein [Methylobacter sp.]|nr:chromate resistance protein [Methylobacter sp.]